MKPFALITYRLNCAQGCCPCFSFEELEQKIKQILRYSKPSKNCSYDHITIEIAGQTFEWKEKSKSRRIGMPSLLTTALDQIKKPRTESNPNASAIYC